MSRKALVLILSLLASLPCFTGCASREAWTLKTEHIALDVASPENTAKWWCKNLGFDQIVKQTEPPFAIFIRERQGKFAIELYRAANSPKAPDYHQMNPLQFHIALVSNNLDKDIARLMAAGAVFVSRQMNNGSELVMLRDPSGIPLQLVQRQTPVLK